MSSWINEWILGDNDLWSTDDSVLGGLVDFFFFLNFRINGVFVHLFPLPCTVVRHLAHNRVLKLLLPGQQWPSFQIWCTFSPPFYFSRAVCCIWHCYNFSTFEALNSLLSGVFSHVSWCQPSHPHRLLFLWLHLNFLLVSSGYVLGSRPFVYTEGHLSHSLCFCSLTIIPRLGSWVSMLLILPPVSLVLPPG